MLPSSIFRSCCWVRPHVITRRALASVSSVQGETGDSIKLQVWNYLHQVRRNIQYICWLVVASCRSSESTE